MCEILFGLRAHRIVRRVPLAILITDRVAPRANRDELAQNLYMLKGIRQWRSCVHISQHCAITMNPESCVFQLGKWLVYRRENAYATSESRTRRLGRHPPCPALGLRVY
jgi:hypothetical protein